MILLTVYSFWNNPEGIEDRVKDRLRKVKLAPLGIATLALLTERPMHPYEMFQTMLARHDDRVVKVRPGSLYHTVGPARPGRARSGGRHRARGQPARSGRATRSPTTAATYCRSS